MAGSALALGGGSATYGALFGRHDYELATVFTSNLSPEQLARHLGERTAWRIVEMSTIVALEGPNLRIPRGNP